MLFEIIDMLNHQMSVLAKTKLEKTQFKLNDDFRIF